MIYIGYTKYGDDKLWEFFDIQGIEKTFLPEAKGENLVDVIQYLTSGKTDDVFFLEPDHLLRLFKEKSKWNDITKLIKDRNLKLVLYRHTDVITDLADQYHLDKDFLNWLNELAIPILIDGEIGDGIADVLKKCQFIKFRPYYSGKYWLYQLNPIKHHNPDKDYFCLMNDKPLRDHRSYMFEHLNKNNLLADGICNFNKNKDWAKDIEGSYGSEYIRSTDWKKLEPYFLPVIEYYNRTWIEVVVETLGRSHDTDSFYCTEKTFKPIGMSHPFMVVACKNHLKNLHNLGFKTFGDHIDESYDDKENIDDRCMIIADNLIDLKNRMPKFYQDTKHIREHNLKNLAHIYGEYNLEWWNTMSAWWKNFKGGNNG
tara:strand:- start:184 stop:1293 length:1110 start_codon:yes stop_codon:yes gene_type:complete